MLKNLTNCEYRHRHTCQRPFDAPAPGSKSADMGLIAARRVRVLCVDDEQQLVNTLARLLKAMGHEAHVAYDGATALGAARTLRPEIVLLDVGLPQTDGYEIARRLRASNTVPGMRLVALTGYGREEDRERARAAGFDDHLLKPADLAALQELLGRESPR